LQQKINNQNTIVEVFQTLVDEDQSKFEIVFSLDLGFCVEVEALEDSHKATEKVPSVVRMYVSQIDSSFEVFRQAQPQPSTGLVVSHSYATSLEETCTFCGLGFEPIWAACFSSCKHLYHDWCFHYHFERNIKCAIAPCTTEMHNKWWDAIRLRKPSSVGSTMTPTDSEVCTSE